MGLQVATTSSSPSTSFSQSILSSSLHTLNTSSTIARRLERIVECKDINLEKFATLERKNIITSTITPPTTTTTTAAVVTTAVAAVTTATTATEQFKNELEVTSQKQNQKEFSLPNVSISNEMAPALTEPLSSTNQLKSSATSASPRPLPSNNYSLNNNITNIYGTIANNNGNSNHLLNSSVEVQSSTAASNNGSFLPAKKAGQLIISTTSVSSSTTTTTTTNSSSNLNGKGAFQLVFEEVVAKQTADQAVRRKRIQLLTTNSPSNGVSVDGLEVPPMCDKDTDTKINGSSDNTLSPNQENNLVEENNSSNFVACEELSTDNRMDLGDNESYNVDEAQQQQQQQQQSQQKQYTDENQLLQQDDEHEQENQNETGQEQDQQFVVEKVVEHEAIKQNKDSPNLVSSTDQELSNVNDNVTNDDSQNSTIQQCENISRDETPDTTQEVPVATTSSSCTEKEVEVQQQIQDQSQSQNQQNIEPSTSTQQNMPPNMGLNKDFIKDSSEMEQVLGEFTSTEIDLLQVLKGFEATPGGDTVLCDLAGSLGLFNDVDCMNYEEVGTPAKDSPTREIRNEIEKRQQQMQRKCDFLLRRLRKIQSRYMEKHTSEEIAGLFEWTNRLVRRKDSDRTLTYEDDKYRPVSVASMKAFLKRIDVTASAQHSNIKRSKSGNLLSTGSSSGSNVNSPSSSSTPQTGVNTSPQQQQHQNDVVVGSSAQRSKSPNVVVQIIPQLDDKTVAEIEHVAGMLQTELKEVQSALDSDVTASSSGGESADEMVTYNNQVQQPMSIAKRAAWRWARDRSAIASRWTWLLTQISDLEYRIKQYTELHNQIKKNKGIVICGDNPPNSNISETTVSSSSSSSVNGYRGVLPGNSKALDVDTVPPLGTHDEEGSSCRTRPFQRCSFRKRRLMQTAHLHTVTKKAARSSTVKCGCQWPLPPCALCTGRPDPTAPRDLPNTMSLPERVALLDPGFHPVLSFPEDISSSIYLEGVMCTPDWQNRVMRCTTKSALKGALAAQKAVEREDRSKKFTDSRRKYNRKFSQDVAANKLKNAKNRRALHGAQITHLMKNKHRKNSSSNAGATGSLSTPNHHSGLYGGGFSSTLGLDSSTGLNFSENDPNFVALNGVLPRSKNSSPTPFGYGGSNSSFKNERMDRRSRNSYDIDNIVIPYSVAAATRVEILPYKEIPTPKWRVVDDENMDTTDKTNVDVQPHELLPQIDGVSDSNVDEMSEKCLSTIKSPSTTEDTVVQSISSHETQECNNFNEENEIEDISDDAIQMRHDKALLEEKKKFQTYLKFPWSTRSRANRRIDSRTESSGANTPDPTSPAPNTPSIVCGDQESIPSPNPPSTPQTPLENMETLESGAMTPVAGSSNQTLNVTLLNNQLINSARKERKRTVSAKREREKDEMRRSNSPDMREVIPPFESLQFPLSDELYETMLQMMPNDHQILEDCIKNINNCDKNSDTKNNTTDYVIQNHRILNNINTHNTIISQNNPRILNSLIYNTTFDENDTLMDGDSDTDSAESGLPDEDPNDPEWREPA